MTIRNRHYQNKKRIKNDFSSAFHRIHSDRHLRFRRWLLDGITYPGTGGDAVSLDDNARVYRCHRHLTDDTGTYRHQLRHVLRLHRRTQCRNGWHDGDSRKHRGNLRLGSPLPHIDDSHQQDTL